MNLNIDLQNITLTEFGVGRDNGDDETFVSIPVDRNVQTALSEMVDSTCEAMRSLINKDGPTEYEPSEKHGEKEYLILPIDNDMSATVRELHEAININIDNYALSNPTNIYCYFARLEDKSGNKLTALRRASQFKGILKGKLIHIMDETLKIIEDHVFKLDRDFDFLVDSTSIHILRPSGFESIGKLQQAILDAVPDNIKVIKQAISFVKIESIESYAKKHTRAARYLASIVSQDEISNISKSALQILCRNTGVNIKDENGKIVIQSGHEMGFLEVLDRRRYEIELIDGSPERYKAPSRKKLNTTRAVSSLPYLQGEEA